MSTMKRLLSTPFAAILLAAPLATPLVAQITPFPAPYFIPMDAPKVTPNDHQVVVANFDLGLGAGDTRRVFARASFINNSNNVLEAIAAVECHGADGIYTGFSSTNQNHDGQNTPPGPSYPYKGLLALYPSLLLHAWASQTYTCQLIVSDDSPSLSVVAKDPGGHNATWMQMDSANEAGASWSQNLSCGTAAVPTAANHYSSCVYLGGASGQTVVYEFENDGSPVHPWVAPDNVAFAAADANLQVSTCYYNTGSCSSDNSESWWHHEFDSAGGTEVDSHMELTQLNAQNKVCNITRSPDHTTWIDNNAHHYVLYYSIPNAPVLSTCGSRIFKVRVYVKYLSGNPVKFEGSSTLPGQTIFTHAYVYTSATGEAVPVPDVITLSQSAAISAITGAGFTVSDIIYATNPAPAGTVISQYPAPGAIAYPGSGVTFAVSTGGAVVPNLSSLSESAAISDINALGLVPSVFSSKACVDPGDVLNQSPSAGTTVALGTTVYITIDSGTFKTCVIK